MDEYRAHFTHTQWFSLYNTIFIYNTTVLEPADTSIVLQLQCWTSWELHAINYNSQEKPCRYVQKYIVKLCFSGNNNLIVQEV